MIENFDSKCAEDIYNGINSRYSRKLPQNLHAKARRLLDQLNATTKVETLSVPHSNHLEKLKGNLAGYWSLRINKQWRIVFIWKEKNAFNVDILDYH